MGCSLYLVVALLLSTARVDADCIGPRDGSEVLLCPLVDNAPNGPSRRLLSTPSKNTSLSMFVRPSWKLWAGLNFAHGFANGIVAMEQLWGSSVDKYFDTADAAGLVRVTNFEGGTSGIVQQPIVALHTKAGEIREVVRQFNGAFKQSFDAHCYPFDHQEVSFEIAIDFPISKYWELYLLCNEGEESKDVAGNAVEHTPGSLTTKDITSCTKELGTSAVGMAWQSMSCTKASTSSIKCTMTGHRLKTRIILNFIVPSLLVAMMSFTSFQLPCAMAMPRIATTMIAMLTLINLKYAVSEGLPGSGSLSWIEEYFMFAIIFMFVNLCCHVAVMRADKKGHKVTSDLLDDLGCGISFCLFMMIPFAKILTTKCTGEGISEAEAAVVLVLGSLLLVFLVAKALVTKTGVFKGDVVKLSSTGGSAAETPMTPMTPAESLRETGAEDAALAQTAGRQQMRV